ncbi:hypothetical protein [Macrococcus capreoli]|uniref:hypothetical protein n=1 Tax=Macrococcus capreoli TaxID=2982690 RepID=UPI0021D5B30D|nr:hypothetical protein [Macrococcus sp. TMW 2.2395]MCU7558555.1 hypothetical protein [Macrococcus sp. TMW 2.2395]
MKNLYNNNWLLYLLIPLGIGNLVVGVYKLFSREEILLFSTSSVDLFIHSLAIISFIILVFQTIKIKKLFIKSNNHIQSIYDSIFLTSNISLIFGASTVLSYLLNTKVDKYLDLNFTCISFILTISIVLLSTLSIFDEYEKLKEESDLTI